MKLALALSAVCGVLLGTVIVAWQGAAAVLAALQVAGWPAFAGMLLYHALPLALCAFACRMLLTAPRPGALWFMGFRWLRDAGGDILALVPGTGELLAIRAMMLRRLDVGTAAAATVVDVTVEMCAQLGFTLVGLAVLALSRPRHPLIGWAAIGAAALGALAVVVVIAQRSALLRLVERLAPRLAASMASEQIRNGISAIYARPAAVTRASAIHGLAWFAGIGEAAIGFHMMHVPIGLASLVVLESLVYALRTAAFFVPAAAGVQEGGYAILGAALGIGPEFALALSLLKRGRELAFGVPALLLWQAFEGRFLWRKRVVRRSA